MKRKTVLLTMLLFVLLFVACTENGSAGTTTPQTATTVESTVAEKPYTAEKRAIAESYWGTWYMSGYKDVTLTISEQLYSGQDEYAMQMEFSELAPKHTLFIPYKSWDTVMETCEITLEQDKITVYCDGLPYTFVKKAGTKEILSEYPHLATLGTWYLAGNPNATMEIAVTCVSRNYNNSYVVKFAGFDDETFMPSMKYSTDQAVLLYVPAYFGREDSEKGLSMYFDGDTLNIRRYSSTEMDFIEAAFVREEKQ